MASTPTQTRRSSRLTSSLNAVKMAVSPKIRSSVDSVKAAVSPKIKASVNSVKAAVSPSNIVNACRRASRRAAANKAQRKASEKDDSVKSVLFSELKAAESPDKSDKIEVQTAELSAILGPKVNKSQRKASKKDDSAKPVLFSQLKAKESPVKSEKSVAQTSEPPVKMGPEEVKQQLGTCGRLDILRSRLVKINRCGSKVKDFKKEVETVAEETNNNLKDIKPAKVKTTKTKSDKVLDPAHERYMHLAAKPEEGLVLPAKHKVLNDYFRAVDTVISLLYNRQETATFSKVQFAVQEMMRKGVSQDMLAKIKTIFPEAYSFRQDKSKKLMSNNIEYNLVITPCFQYKESDTDSKQLKMTSADISERRNIFLNSLIQMIKIHHDKFLETLDGPSVSTGDLKRWHPEFDLAEVPDIELSSLPQPPEEEKFDNAVDVLSKAMCMFNLDQGESNTTSTPPQQEDAPLPPPKVNSALKGVSSSLLEKIRAREAAKASLSAATKSKSQCKELDMLNRLPEVARIIRTTFITERKAAIPWEMLVNKVSATFSSSIQDRDVDDHLNRLVKEAPGWLAVCKVSSGTYLKINRNIDVNDIIAALCKLIKSKQ
ncbi:unnamed protein product, partial [Meganyctiphanes norvegica]